MSGNGSYLVGLLKDGRRRCLLSAELLKPLSDGSCRRARLTRLLWSLR
jgi:hypothetical protein